MNLESVFLSCFNPRLPPYLHDQLRLERSESGDPNPRLYGPKRGPNSYSNTKYFVVNAKSETRGASEANSLLNIICARTRVRCLNNASEAESEGGSTYCRGYTGESKERRIWWADGHDCIVDCLGRVVSSASVVKVRVGYRIRKPAGVRQVLDPRVQQRVSPFYCKF